MENEFALLVGLCLVPGIGGVTFRNLLERFGTVQAIRQASPDALQAVSGVGPHITAAIQSLNPADTEASINRWRADGITLLTASDLRYPALLYALRDAPPLLFCRGKPTLLTEHTVAIVGTRHPSPASRTMAERMGAALAKRGWIVISGLAWGVDMAAHTGALQEGLTAAILGGGLNTVQPKKHALAQRILESGAIFSEQPPDAPPGPAGLVARNRLISGMSQAVIVVEADENSGSLYTARFAYRQQRPILAVDNGSRGNARILDSGAHRIAPDFTDWDQLDSTLRALKTGTG